MDILTVNFDNMMRVFLIIICAFFVMIILMSRLIPVLVRFKFDQEERDDGPKSHMDKKGTPTMGGIVILISILAASLAGMIGVRGVNVRVFQILFLTLACGFTGLADDYLKVKRHNTTGLTPTEKMIAQVTGAFIFVLWLYFSRSGGGSSHIQIPFTNMSINLPIWAFLPFSLFITLGTDNGVNFTDGLDGLCSSVTLCVSGMYIALGLLEKDQGVTIMASAVFGALLGYLLFNSYPARIFMGDTGSLALGGFVSATAFALGVELYIPIFGFIYMMEVISVIIQVAYFKRTHGKRFFRMAPIHHHFELSGSSETRIVAIFTSVTVLLCMISFTGILM